MEQALPHFAATEVDEAPNEAESLQLMRDVFVQNVLMVGSKSFSHMLNALERFDAGTKASKCFVAIRGKS